ncbi:MAG: septation ring formation regulator EzrA [Bacilli bacterium]|nr:septation ring formation regulator EzrA [Bacilli bacterium]
MDKLTIVIIAYILIAIILILIALLIIKKKKIKAYKNEIEILDKKKNEIESAPVISELAKLETIVKNEKMEEKYKKWFNTFEDIKSKDIPRINDMIIDLDSLLDKKEYKEYVINVAKVELEIYKARGATDNLLDEIKEINLSEEKYRKIITKLKTRYRELNDIFNSKKKEYEQIANPIELQFENIEKLFQDFEYYMEQNDYQEVYHIVKGIDKMIDHMGIVIEEVPDLVLLANRLIPKKIEQITEVYGEMKAKKFPLKHLKIEYNVEESLKNVNKILDRIKVLNLENCMFELKTMLEYLDSLFDEFELERQAKKSYEENKEIFDNKLEKTTTVVNDTYLQMDDIKNMYDLNDNDIKSIDVINEKTKALNDEYKALLKSAPRKKTPYTQLSIDIENFIRRLKEIEDELDIALKNLGNLYDDEVRAREQLDEIQELLKQSKAKIRSYKLPIISDNYFVELQEANEAILEVIKELERKPIVIKTLNTRVDTARDLVLKLFNTTNEMVKTARLAEYSIVYGNRYRSKNVNIDSGLNQAQMLFYKGNYKKSLEVTLTTLERVDNGIRRRVNDIYEKNN